jgi:hypothetical protein
VAESVFATIESELIDDADLAHAQRGTAGRVRSLEVWYNRRRRHSSLGVREPGQAA